ncbi:MAG: alkaline phosphatase family protein, partial [Deltaproteobacteria bacterium]|nr:alkaline phosphatase family protein [Deltaproteobacteria bacterium]
GEQGLNGNEIQVFERIKQSLSQAKGLSMLITRKGDEYFVYSKRGEISFRRIYSDGRYEYPVSIISGSNPIQNTDEKAYAIYSDEIKAGDNPENTQYTGAGYSLNDERISFISEEKTTYPFAYERIAQLFDDPNSGDIIGLPEPYGDGLYEIGAHGHLDITQSRSPLIFSGKGVKKEIIYENAVKAVDIAPTVLKILGGSKMIGVNRFNQITKDNYLRRQDGDVIEDILSGEKAEYAVIIVSDGLSHTELERALNDAEYNIPNLKSLLQNGVFFKYGQITNYFSVTLPSHTTIGTGLYAGHHGIVNNLFYLREKGKILTLVDLGVGPSRYLRPEAETIFEAYHRNFGRYDPKTNKNGKVSASVNQPCTRGAVYATLESLIFNFSDYKYEPLPVIEELKQVTSADNTAVNQMIYLFEKGELPLPNLVMINLTSTDSAGHGWGPHSDMVKKALEQTDFRIGKIIELYKNAKIFEKTLFVFTSDHAMEIQDINRSFEYKIDGTKVTIPLLDSLGIKYIGGLPFIYFETMGYRTDKAISSGSGKYIFSVFDEERGIPLKSAVVRIIQDGRTFECISDEKGECSIGASLTEGKVLIRIDHSAYNYIEEEISIK